MPQATSPISRRAFIQNAAAAPMLTVALPAAISLGSDGIRELSAFRPQLEECNRQIMVCADAIERAEKAMALWHKRNPKPETPDWKPDEDTHSIMAEQSRRFSKWVERRGKAQHDSRLGRSKLAQNEALNLREAICEQAAECDVTTVAALKVKAELATEFSSDAIAWAIVGDLQELTTENLI